MDTFLHIMTGLSITAFSLIFIAIRNLMKKVAELELLKKEVNDLKKDLKLAQFIQDINSDKLALIFNPKEFSHYEYITPRTQHSNLTPDMPLYNQFQLLMKYLGLKTQIKSSSFEIIESGPSKFTQQVNDLNLKLDYLGDHFNSTNKTKTKKK